MAPGAASSSDRRISERCDKKLRPPKGEGPGTVAPHVCGVPDVKEVSSLLPLIEPSELGGEQLVEYTGREVRGLAEPGRFSV